MKLLITGANGFIGKACVEGFSSRHLVVGADLGAATSTNHLPIQDPADLAALLQKGDLDAVINCAGSSNIQASFDEPLKDFEANVLFVQELVDLLRRFSPGTRLINLSSAAVYGNPAVLPVSETATLAPLSPYGFHKQLSEALLEASSKFYGLSTLSVRIFSAYGPGLRRQLFYDLYQKFSSSPAGILLNGTGHESRDFIFVYDVLRALDVLLQKAPAQGEVYNLASGQEISIREAAELFAGICGYKGAIQFNGEQTPGYPRNWLADTRRLQQLGFEHGTTLREGLDTYYRWLQQ